MLNSQDNLVNNEALHSETQSSKLVIDPIQK